MALLTDVQQPVHGTLTAYTNHRCRCAQCRASFASYYRTRRRARVSLPVPADVRHGSRSTYSNYNCRCEPCRVAHREYMRCWRAAR